MAQQTIKQEGCFDKTQRTQINDNFTELYAAVGQGTGNITTENITVEGTASIAGALTGSTAAFTSVTGIGTTQTYRTSSALTKNASEAYANITGLSASLVAGATYKFRCVLPSTVASGTGGIKYCFAYTTATLTSIESTSMGYTASAVAVQHTTTTTTQTDLFTQAEVVIMTVIEGTMVVNAAGTMDVQMAQNTSDASNTVALVGGTLQLQRIA